MTTIPAAADIGVSSAFENWSEARGLPIQLLLNVAILIAVGAVGLTVQRRMWTRITRRTRRPRACLIITPFVRERRRSPLGSRRTPLPLGWRTKLEATSPVAPSNRPWPATIRYTTAPCKTSGSCRRAECAVAHTDDVPLAAAVVEPKGAGLGEGRLPGVTGMVLVARSLDARVRTICSRRGQRHACRPGSVLGGWPDGAAASP